MKKIINKRRIYMRRRIVAVVITLLILAGIIILVAVGLNGGAGNFPISQSYIFPDEKNPTSEGQNIAAANLPTAKPMIYPTMAANAKTFTPDNMGSKQGVLLDVSSNEIIEYLDCDARIFPASLTKIMTLIVATEHITNMNDTFIMTEEIVKLAMDEGASRAGFLPGEKLTLTDLLYGAILPSGADATIALAEKLCGSEAEFVQLMNEKAEELGLLHTHFVNSSGLHDDNHYTTAVDMAMILQYATEDELCRKILSTYEFTTSETEQNPDGILLTSTMFSRMYGNEAPGVTIEGGKMGFTDEAGNCLASFATKGDKTYIAVTAGGAGKYMPIYDAIKIYTNCLS